MVTQKQLVELIKQAPGPRWTTTQETALTYAVRVFHPDQNQEEQISIWIGGEVRRAGPTMLTGLNLTSMNGVDTKIWDPLMFELVKISDRVPIEKLGCESFLSDSFRCAQKFFTEVSERDDVHIFPNNLFLINEPYDEAWINQQCDMIEEYFRPLQNTGFMVEIWAYAKGGGPVTAQRIRDVFHQVVSVETESGSESTVQIFSPNMEGYIGYNCYNEIVYPITVSEPGDNEEDSDNDTVPSLVFESESESDTDPDMPELESATESESESESEEESSESGDVTKTKYSMTEMRDALVGIGLGWLATVIIAVLIQYLKE